MAKYEIKDGIGIIPKGTTEIEEDAFKDCEELKAIVIPDSVDSIGKSAFSGCTNLSSVKMGEGVYYIGEGAFSRCSSLKEIVLPDSLSTIGRWAFNMCSALSKVNLGKGVYTIRYGAFSRCVSLTKVVIPASVCELSSGVFEGCVNLVSLSIDKANEVYDSRRKCNAVIETSTNTLLYGIAASTIPNSVTRIAKEAFEKCEGLTTVVIPKSVVAIGESAFNSCEQLTSVVIGDGVERIGAFAFSGCGNLQTLKLGKSLKRIGDCAFSQCDSLVSVDLPKKLVHVGEKVFSDCDGLTSAVIPKTWTEVPTGLFHWCENLSTVVIPDTVTEIGAGAFNSTSLVSVEIPKAVTRIGDSAFAGTKLAEVTIPASVQIMGNSAFMGCASLKTFTFEGKVKQMGVEVFEECDALQKIVVPDKALSFYKDRIDEMLHGILETVGNKGGRKKTLPPLEEWTYPIKSGTITIRKGDLFRYGEKYVDRESYCSNYRFYTDFTYKVVEVYQRYVVIDEEGHPVKLYSNQKTDYFTTLPPKKFNKQWSADSYSPRYYLPIDADDPDAEVDKRIHPLEQTEETKVTKPKRKTFLINGVSYTERKIISILRQQIPRLSKYAHFGHAEIDLIYENAAGELFFNVFAENGDDEMTVKIGQDEKIYWDWNGQVMDDG